MLCHIWHHVGMTTPTPRAKSDTSRAALDPATARICDELVARIKALIAAGAWTQQMAAKLCGLTQPRITGPAHNGMVIVQYADKEPIKGLLDSKARHGHGTGSPV